MSRQLAQRNAWTEMDRAGQQERPSGDSAGLELWAYLDAYTYRPGERVAVKVHTTASSFDLEVIRDSGSGERMHAASGVAGCRQATPPDAFATGCGWEDSHVFPIPRSWPAGVYLITLRALREGEAVESETFFVLAPGEPGSMTKTVLVLATGTYVAYNDWGGANAYRRTIDGVATEEPAPRLSLCRPMARGLLRMPIGAPRYTDSPDLPPFGHPRYPWLEWAFAYGYSRHCRDSGWATYERPFAHWAAREGYRLEFLTQHDLHFNPECLLPYRNVILVGHDEYWSVEMREAIDAHVDRGGNVSRFGANFLWQVRIEDEGRTQVCYKNPIADPIFETAERKRTTSAWDFEFIGRPGARTMGLTGLGGVYSRFGTAAGRASGGLTVYRPDHWVFEGSDLYYGDVFGQGARIASFEVDGVDYTFRHGLPFPTHADAAPESLEILAMATAVRGEINRRGYLLNGPLDDSGALLAASRQGLRLVQQEALEASIFGSAMVGVFSRNGGTVFNSGTTEWVNGLIEGDFFVSRITRNVLDRLG